MLSVCPVCVLRHFGILSEYIVLVLSRDLEALSCFGVRIASDRLRDINIAPIGKFYINFLDSKENKYVFHIHFIYNSRNIHSQINSWIYYVTISFSWFSTLKLNWTEWNGYFFWLSASVETLFWSVSITQETLWNLLLWVSCVTLCQFVLSKTRNLMTFVILTILVNILDTNESTFVPKSHHMK